MKYAYLDSSCLVALACGEPGSTELAGQLADYTRLFAANLLEAEVRAALAREGVPGVEKLLGWVSWLHPPRPLSQELREVLGFGYLRGADLWHLAAALYLRGEIREISFLTLDRAQGERARALGFPGF